MGNYLGSILGPLWAILRLSCSLLEPILATALIEPGLQSKLSSLTVCFPNNDTRLGPSWACSGAILGNHLGAILGSSWAILGPSCSLHGFNLATTLIQPGLQSTLSSLMVCYSTNDMCFGPFWALVRPSGGSILEPPWGHLGTILWPSWAYLGNHPHRTRTPQQTVKLDGLLF